MTLQVIHALEALQISISLVRAHAKMDGKLAYECHCISDEIFLFMCHTVLLL